jgi:DNA-binding protein H-NS
MIDEMSFSEMVNTRNELEKKILEAASDEITKIRAQIKLVSRETGISYAKLVAALRPTLPTKYIGPNGEVWTGRGKQPKWLSDLVAQGHSEDEFTVTEEAPTE